MNLQQSIRKIKDGLLAGLGFNQKLPDREEHKPAGIISLCRPVLSGPITYESYIPDGVAALSIKLSDRAGRTETHEFNSGNICIIGDYREITGEFLGLLKDLFRQQKTDFHTINASQFDVDSMIRHEETTYLIRSHSRIPLEVNRAIFGISGTICIFGLEGLNMSCPLHGSTRSNLRAHGIVNALGGNIPLRAAMISSLRQNEFVLIEGNRESVRSFKSDSVRK